MHNMNRQIKGQMSVASILLILRTHAPPGGMFKVQLVKIKILLCTRNAFILTSMICFKVQFLTETKKIFGFKTHPRNLISIFDFILRKYKLMRVCWLYG